MSFLPKVQPYAVINLDLTNARAVVPIGSVTTNTGQLLNAWLANQVFINTLSVGATLSFGIQDNTVAGGMITAVAGTTLPFIPFDEIFFTNTAQPGATAQIVISYV